MKKRLAGLTKYPEFFWNTYWGQCLATLPDGSPTDPPKIIEARNRFVESYGVTRMETSLTCYRLMSAMRDAHGADHPEAYRCRDGSIVVAASMYGDSGHTLGAAGFERIAPMYHEGAATWARRFSGLPECRRLLGQLQKQNPGACL